MSNSSNFKVQMFLADAAQIYAGKVSVLGAGWNWTRPGFPSAVVAGIGIPWDKTNRQHHWRLSLEDADGHAVMHGNDSEGFKPIQGEAPFELGRPPGTPEGVTMTYWVTMNCGPLPIKPDQSYVWRLEINNLTNEDWSLPFWVRDVQPQPA